MALKFLDYCKDATQTSGTGSLTLDDSGAAGWQTLKDAVDRGLVSDGDTIRYFIRDTSDPVLFEEGVGEVGSGGLSLTRPSGSVRQSSSGTSLISWPSGGARDVILGISPGDFPLLSNEGSDYTAATFASNLGLPRLAAANSFTADQTVKIAGSIGRMILGSTASSGLCAAFNLIGNDSAGNETTYGQLRQRILDATNGAEDGALELVQIVAGSLTETHQFNGDGSIDNSVTGNKYDAFPSGTPLMFGAAPPTGWTRVDVTGERMPKLATSSDTAGATGGTWTVGGLSGSTTVNAHTLTLSEIPSHSHNYTVAGGGVGGLEGFVTDDTESSTGTGTTLILNAGGGGSHSHTASTTVSSAGSWRPAYEIWVKATKNS